MTLVIPIGNTYTGNTTTGNTFLSSYSNGATYLYVVNLGPQANIVVGNTSGNYASIPLVGNTTIVIKKAASDIVFAPATVHLHPLQVRQLSKMWGEKRRQKNTPKNNKKNTPKNWGCS
jgi:hypothetical protein